MTDVGEPSSYEEAVSDEHKNKWSETMQNEMKSLYENDAFELVSLPKGKKALKNKWMYRVKIEDHSSDPRYKARLVVKGFCQKRALTSMRYPFRWSRCLRSELCLALLPLWT
jgi:hypothetical protein